MQLTPDPLDRATELEMAERESVIALAHSRYEHAAAQRRAADESITCLNCDASITQGTHFCDADCRDDYEVRNSARTRNGSPFYLET